MTDVTTQHTDYTSNCAKWCCVEDAAAGEAAVKAKKDRYLPRPNPTDKSPDNCARYEQYLARAVYYNATGRTLGGLTGLAFSSAPEVEVPAPVDFVQQDVSGAGLTLIQQAQAVLGEVLKTGRAGLLVDYPPTDAPVSKADENGGDIRPTVTFYPATAIINWRTVRRAGRTVLSLVVLSEQHEIPDGFGAKSETQYRVLRLEPVYTVEIWRKIADPKTRELKWIVADSYLPTRGDGKPWQEIPFQFVGSKNNDWNVDDAPLYDLAVLNLAHYRNSADYEDSVFFCGQPQFYIAGLTEEWRDHLEKQGIYVGSRAVLPLPQGGSAGILQAQPNTLAKEAMDGKQKQMAALGARLIQADITVKTATQQKSEDTVAHSVLSLTCDNVSSGYAQALEWFGIFANVEGDTVFQIPTEFASSELDAQMLAALLQLVQSGNLPQTDLWSRLRNAGLIDSTKTDEMIQEEIDSQSPGLGLSLGAGKAAPGTAGAIDIAGG